jgi:hypothetical protein
MKPHLVQRQPGPGQPGCTAGLGDPDDFVGLQHFALPRLQAAGLDAADFGVEVELHAALSEHRLEGAAHRRVVRGKDPSSGGKQVEAQFVGIAAMPGEFVAQAVLHRQRQFDTGRPGADHGDRGCPGMGAYSFE